MNTATQLAAGRVSGRIHSWDLSTGVYGPGTRFVLFISGCPLRCLYCADPDTWHMRDGRKATVDEVMVEIGTYRSISTAGGGVTLTGGEPLLQPARRHRSGPARHQVLGAHKYDALGLPFPLRDTATPAPEPTGRVRESVPGARAAGPVTLTACGPRDDHRPLLDIADSQLRNFAIR